MLHHALRPLVAFIAVLLAGPAWATWSIVVLNRATGEVAVATSTCLSNFNIATAVPVIRVGYGAGAAQSFVNFQASNRRLFFNNVVRNGATPTLLLDAIEAADPGFQLRQFGFVSVWGAPATHTGTQNFQAALGVTGEVDGYEYAIQGNILTGANVIADCEAAFVGTQGDLSERLIVAMEAARDAGGDGRCSCSQSAPTSCGSPPANFAYASYNAFMAIARLGDTDGVCNGAAGCATGDYYMRFNYIGNAASQEPIAYLRQEYDMWRADLIGRPDQALSRVDSSLPVLQADGITTSRVTITLVDVDGNPLASGGQTVSIERTNGPDVASVSSPVDNGDGTHTFELTSTQATGEARFTITVDDGIRPVQLAPALRVTSTGPSPLHPGALAYSASEGSEIPLVATFAGAGAGAPYRIFASLSGTTPGTPFGGTVIPLVNDRFFQFTRTWNGAAPFLGSTGTLDANDRGIALFDPPAGSLSALVGSTIHFAGYANGANGPLTIGPVDYVIEL